MRKTMCALLVLGLTLGVGAGVVWAEKWVEPNGISGYSASVLIEKFNLNEYAVKAELKAKGNQVVVMGYLQKVKEDRYFPDPLGGEGGVEGRVPAVVLNLLNIYSPADDFVGYLFDDPIDPAVLQIGSTTYLLCEDIQRGISGLGLQAKCKVVSSGATDNKLEFHWHYINKELDNWLNTPAQGKAEAE